MPAIIPILIGVAAGAGTKAALDRKKNAAQNTAPAPKIPSLGPIPGAGAMLLGADSSTAPSTPTPPDATEASSKAAAAAKLAGDKQRKRAAGAGTMLGGATLTGPVTKAKLQPRTLLGY